MEMLGSERAHEMTLQGLKRRIGRLDRLPFLKPMKEGKDAFAHILAAIRAGQSVVLDFGDYGTDQMVYLFVANILSRRLFDLYTEQNEDFPRLVLFLEEAHKFLSPEIAPYAHTFSRLARETRKRSEEHTSELQSPYDLVCRLLLEKKKHNINNAN